MEFLKSLEPFILQIYGAFIVIDFISGILASAKEGKLKSRSMRDGIFRTCAEIVLLSSLIYFKAFIPLDFVMFGILMISLGLIVKEGLSITENLYRLGVAVPNFITKGLEIANETLDNLDGIPNNNQENK